MEQEEPPEEQETTEARGRRFFLIAGAFELSLGVVALLIGAVIGVSPLSRLTVGSAGVFSGVAATIPLLVLFHVFLRLELPPVARIRSLLYRLLSPVSSQLTVSTALLLGFAAGLGEELLFRGLLQDGLVAVFGLTPGILLGAVVFGLLHAVTPFYAAYAAVLGGFLGLLYHLSGSLLAPIIAHSLYDAFGLILLRRRLPDR